MIRTSYTGYASSIAVSGNNIFAGSAGTAVPNGIYLSTNNGGNWIQIDNGFDFINIRSLYIANNYIYAGTVGNSLWRRPLWELITGVENISSEVPVTFSLGQNYPNPFNPITNVKFSILNAGNVKIIVYDVQGREVQTLVNETLKPGTYETTFDGSALNSGIYFYQLFAEGIAVQTRKMILLK